MESGHLVRFASQPHPFLVETSPCLDLACSCTETTLTFLELVPAGAPPRDRLTFTLRVCLRTWIEQAPPPRSLEVESLVREFLARFPAVGAAQRSVSLRQRLEVQTLLRAALHRRGLKAVEKLASFSTNALAPSSTID